MGGRIGTFEFLLLIVAFAVGALIVWLEHTTERG